MDLSEHWTMSECPDCGALTCATTEQLAWCDEHCKSNLTVVDVVRATPRWVVSPRQDSLDDQLRDVRKLAEQAGCYAAADWIRARTLYESDTDHPRGVVGDG